MKKFILSVLTATPLFVTPLISLTSCGEQKEKIMVTIQTNEGGEVKTSSIRVNHGSIFKDIKKRLEKCVEAKYTYRLEKWVDKDGEDIKEYTTIDEDFIVKAIFEKIPIDLTIKSSDEGIVLQPIYQVPMGTKFKDVKANLTKCIKARDLLHWFYQWVDGQGKEINDELEILEPLTITATFTDQVIPITISTDEYGFIVDPNYYAPKSLTFGKIKPYLKNYVRLAYQYKKLFEFDKWINVKTGLELTDDFVLDGESSFEFKATYKHQILSLSISSDEHGSVIEQTKQINKNSKYSEVKDQLIACVHATDPTTYQFDHFEDEQGQRIYDNTILDHNQMIKAFFSIIPITIGDYSYAFDKVTGSATVIAYLGSSEEITVPDNVQDAEGNNYKVTAIGYRAFYDSNTATKITLPSSCIELGEEAFFHCSKLTLVTISKDIKYLPTRCFEECEKLVDVAILNGEEGSVREVGNNCFSGCNQAVFTSLPKSIEILDDGAFSYCENLKSIELPNIVSAGKGCFWGCYGLKKVLIPSSWKTIGESCFEGCCDLAQVTTVDGQVSQLESLGDSAFYDCDALNNIVLPDSLQRIGRLCFGNCGGLTNITLPKSLKSIGSCAFESCAKLADDSGPGGEPGFKYSGSSSAWNKVTKAKDALEATLTNKIKCSDGKIVDFIANTDIRLFIPKCINGVVEPGYDVIKMPSGMLFAEIRKTLDHCIEPKTGYKLIMWVDETGSDISDSKYISENMQCIPVCLKLVDEEIDNIRYAIDEDTNQAMMISHGSSFSYDETIPETITVDQKQYTVTALGPNAYEQFGDSIEHITIPNTVTWVGGHCFNGCLGLESIILSENIKVLPEFCFTACVKLKKIENIQKLTVQRLGWMCFSNCDELEEIVLPESVKSLDSECFSGNPKLKSVILPSSLRSIGNLCFCNCPSLTNTSGDSGVPGIRFNGSIEQWEEMVRGANWHDNKITDILCQGEIIPIDATN